MTSPNTYVYQKYAPKTNPQKCIPKVYPKSIPQKYTSKVYPKSIPIRRGKRVNNIRKGIKKVSQKDTLTIQQQKFRLPDSCLARKVAAK